MDARLRLAGKIEKDGSPLPTCGDDDENLNDICPNVKALVYLRNFAVSLWSAEYRQFAMVCAFESV